jgi:hypothetical protein
MFQRNCFSSCCVFLESRYSILNSVLNYVTFHSSSWIYIYLQQYKTCQEIFYSGAGAMPINVILIIIYYCENFPYVSSLTDVFLHPYLIRIQTCTQKLNQSVMPKYIACMCKLKTLMSIGVSVMGWNHSIGQFE